MATTSDYVKMHFIVFLFGFTAILGKLISLPPVEMVFLRTLLASAGMALIILIKRQGTFQVSAADRVKLLLTGGLVALHWITFFAAARIANVSVSLVGFATASLWSALLEPLAQRTKIRATELLLGGMVIVGMVIIFSFKFHHTLGLLVAILAGLTSALFSIINAKFVTRIHPYTITLYEMSGATIGIALFLPLYAVTWAEAGTLHLIPTGTDLLYISILALGCTVYAYATMVDLLKRVSVFVMQLTINLEPVYGMILAVLLLQGEEKMSTSFYIGALVILSAVMIYPLLKRRMRSAS